MTRAMRRTIAVIKEAWRLWRLWRHNLQVMNLLAQENARFYTNCDIKCDVDCKFIMDPDTFLFAPLDEPEPEPRVDMNPFKRFAAAVEDKNHEG